MDVFINASIVNTQSNLTAITNLSSLNCSFAFCNISTFTCKNGNIINLSSTNCSFQIQNVSYSTIFNLSCTTLNVSTITNVANLNVSLITNISCINSGLNQNLDILANQLNLTLNTNVCFLLNPTHNGDMLICNNINDTGFRIRRYYAGSVSTNVTTIQNADSSALYFTQPVGIGGPVTTNMELEVVGNTGCTRIFAKNLSCVNASFDTIWTNNLIVDPLQNGMLV